MRHPPSPLLLSARKRRPRRNPPRGAQLGSPTPGEQRAEAEMQQAQSGVDAEKCALLQGSLDHADEPAHDDAGDQDPERDTHGRARQR
jgi:hypothetical protein